MSMNYESCTLCPRMCGADRTKAPGFCGASHQIKAARAALRAGAGRLVIDHFSSRYKELAPLLDEARTLFPASDLAEEGRTFTIEKRPFRC